MRKRTRLGFSLVELVIVIIIIGIIAAIAIPNLVNAIQRGRQARTVGDLRGLSTAVAMYQQDFAKYPVFAANTEASELRPHLDVRVVGRDRVGSELPLALRRPRTLLDVQRLAT